MKHRVVSYDKIIASFTDPDDAFILEDHGKSVNDLVSYCDREARLWDELPAVERACARLRTKQLCETVRVVYRVVRFEPCAEDEQRALILRILGLDDASYRDRVRRIIEILTRPRRR